MLFSQLVLFAQEVVEGVKDGAPKDGGGGAPGLVSLVPIVLIFGVFYFLIILPSQRKERKQREAIFAALKKNDEVVTSGGIIGIVQTIKDDEVILKLEDNAKVRLLKSSITRIIPKDSQNTSGSDPNAESIQKLPR